MSQVTKVGRDAQFSDFALNDEYISNPHFSVHLEGSQFYVMDEGSTNGTHLNGMLLQPRQRIPLMPDAVIEVGETQLQFKQLGLPTQRLGRARGGTPSSSPGRAPVGPSSAAPPSQAAPPSARKLNPYETGYMPEAPSEPKKPPSNPYLTQKVDDDQV